MQSRLIFLALAAAVVIGWHPARALAAGGAIAGKVTEASSHKPIEGIEVCAFATSAPGQEEEAETEPDACVKTNSGGEYTISGISAGGYTVGFGDPFPSALNYVTQYYDDKPTSGEAKELTIAGATVPNIDAELEPGAEISGTTNSAATGAPVEGVTACAAKAGAAALEIVSCAVTANGGNYTITGLPSGSYDVIFDGGGYSAQAYNGASTIAGATVLSLGAREIRQGINATLQTLTVQKISPVLPGVGTNPTSPGGMPTGGLSAPKAAVSLLSTRITVANSATALVRLRCSTALACHGKLTLTEKRTARRAGKTISVTDTIGAGRFSLKPDQSATVRIAIGPSARRQLGADRAGIGARLALVQTAPKPARTTVKRVLLLDRRSAPAKG